MSAVEGCRLQAADTAAFSVVVFYVFVAAVAERK
jgi:hypothetical protein